MLETVTERVQINSLRGKHLKRATHLQEIADARQQHASKFLRAKLRNAVESKGRKK